MISEGATSQRIVSFESLLRTVDRGHWTARRSVSPFDTVMLVNNTTKHGVSPHAAEAVHPIHPVSDRAIVGDEHHVSVELSVLASIVRQPGTVLHRARVQTRMGEDSMPQRRDVWRGNQCSDQWHDLSRGGSVTVFASTRRRSQEDIRPTVPSRKSTWRWVSILSVDDSGFHDAANPYFCTVLETSGRRWEVCCWRACRRGLEHLQACRALALIAIESRGFKDDSSQPCTKYCRTKQTLESQTSASSNYTFKRLGHDISATLRREKRIIIFMAQYFA